MVGVRRWPGGIFANDPVKKRFMTINKDKRKRRLNPSALSDAAKGVGKSWKIFGLRIISTFHPLRDFYYCEGT